MYDPTTHSFALVDEFAFDRRPMQIVHTCGGRVWLMACYADEIHNFPGVKVVGDGYSDGYDREGNVIVSIPMSSVKRFMTDDEADQMMEMQSIDYQILSNAH